MDERMALGSRLVKALESIGVGEPAIALLCAAIENGLPKQPGGNNPDTPIDLSQLSPVTRRVCGREQLLTLGALQVLTVAELDRLDELGPKRVAELIACLQPGQRFRKKDEDFLERARAVYKNPLRVPTAAVLIHALGSAQAVMPHVARRGWTTLRHLTQLSFDELRHEEFLGDVLANKLILWLQSNRLHPA